MSRFPPQIILCHTPADWRQRAASGQELAVARLLLQLALIQQHAPRSSVIQGFPCTSQPSKRL